MPQVIYIEADGTEYWADVGLGESVMEAAKREGVPGIDADCGGVCACATCHVYVPAAWQAATGEPGEDEREMLELATDPRPNSRLSCQIVMTTDLAGLVVNVPVSQR